MAFFEDHSPLMQPAFYVPLFRAAGGFFWFVFLSAQENEQRTRGVVNPGLFPESPPKLLSDKHRTAG
jgi:hypothetical protein